MVIAGIVVAVLVFNSVLPAVIRSRDALVTVRGRMDERIKSQIAIIHSSGELDQSATWQDTNGNGDFDVFVWVKNIGALRISAVERIDVFFGPEGNFARIPHSDEAMGAYPSWDWNIENDSEWNQTATIRITISYSSTLPAGRYFIKVVLPNGIADTVYFSM
jgi:hypothetical protein